MGKKFNLKDSTRTESRFKMIDNRSFRYALKDLPAQVRYQPCRWHFNAKVIGVSFNTDDLASGTDEEYSQEWFSGE